MLGPTSTATQNLNLQLSFLLITLIVVFRTPVSTEGQPISLTAHYKQKPTAPKAFFSENIHPLYLSVGSGLEYAIWCTARQTA